MCWAQRQEEMRTRRVERYAREARERECRARQVECHRLEVVGTVAEATRALDARGAYPSQEAVSFELGYNAFDLKGTSRVAYQTYRTTMTALGLPLRVGEACRGKCGEACCGKCGKAFRGK